jgi:hypothetical protein
MASKHVALGLSVAIGLGAAAAPAAAQEGPKLYVFSSGSLAVFRRRRCRWVVRATSIVRP